MNKGDDGKPMNVNVKPNLNRRKSFLKPISERYNTNTEK